MLPVRTTLAAGCNGASTERFIHDAPDGAGTPPTLCATAEAAIDLSGGARRLGMVERRAHVVIAQHVAGTDNHDNRQPPTLVLSVTIDTLLSPSGQKENDGFTRIPIYQSGP
jgi:hypothetical protein